MAFVVRVHLLESAYQAATLEREGAEWPPHPARLVSALVSVADPEDQVQDAALKWLEEQEPPLVVVPDQSVEASCRVAWVPTNAVVGAKKGPSSATLPGRTQGGAPKVWPQRNLRTPELAFVWEAEPAAGVRAVLEQLARAVPYFGRGSGAALVRAGVEAAACEGDGLLVWEPAEDGVSAAGAADVRVPTPGYLQRLRSAHAAGAGAWAQADFARYQVRASGSDPAPVGDETVAGPFEDLVVFAFDRGVSVEPTATLQVTGSLRKKVMGMLERFGHDVEAMPAVHGHTDSDVVRPCAYLGLPFVGRPHADGRLRGVAVALPRGMDVRERKALLAALLTADGGLRRLAVPGFARPAPLTYMGPTTETEMKRWTVRANTWKRSSHVWSTALPMVLDRFPKRNGPGVEEMVAASCRLAGLPEPVEVEVMRRGSLVAGAPDLPGSALRRKANEPPLPARHVRLRFPQPVSGPVVLGSKRNFGLGLCLPADRREPGVNG